MKHNFSIFTKINTSRPMTRFITLVFILLFQINSFSQAGMIDDSLNPNDTIDHDKIGPSSAVNAILVNSDDSFIIGGEYQMYNNDTTGGYLTATDRLGNVNKSFLSNGAPNGTVHCIVRQSDGQLLVGGDFSSFSNIAAGRLIRLNPDGSFDSSFSIGTGFDESVRGVLEQPDGKLIVYGDFESYNGITQHKVIRLNPDGSQDFSFYTTTEIFTSSDLYTGVLLQNGAMVFGGRISRYSGLNVGNLLKLNPNGTVESIFTANRKVDEYVHSIVVQKDGKLLVAGEFDDYNGTSITGGIMRISYMGVLDNSFKYIGPSGWGSLESVKTIQLLNNGNIIIGHMYHTENVVLLDTNGLKINSLYNGLGNIPVRTIKELNSGQIIIGGNFGYFTDRFDFSVKHSRKYLSVRNTDFTPTHDFLKLEGAHGYIKQIIKTKDNKFYINGDVGHYNHTEGQLLRIDINGNIDTVFNPKHGFKGYRFAEITTDYKNRLIISSVDRFSLARLNPDGSEDTTFISGLDLEQYQSVYQFNVLPSNKIIITGSFTLYRHNGVNVLTNRIALLNEDGTLDTTFSSGNGFNNRVHVTKTQRDGKIIIAGEFSNYNGTSVNGICRIDTNGLLDTSFNPANYSMTFPDDIEELTDGRILIGGVKASFLGVDTMKLICLNADGSSCSTFKNTGEIDGGIHGIIEDSTGVIVIGEFSNFYGFTSKGIIRLHSDGTIDSSYTSAGAANDMLYTGCALKNNQLLVGGNFSTINGKDKNFLAKLNGGTRIVTSQTNVKAEEYLIYPNPNNGQFYVIGSTVPLVINVFDFTGKLVKSIIPSRNNSFIDLSEVGAGTYLIVIISSNESQVNKIVVE
jgi:uncharacterized delta-60 repeat protein